jgi:tRNA1(Val) A37 N6-methylase TrmN6
MFDAVFQMDTIVDLCSGRGFVTRHLTSHSAKKLVAVEMSPAMLEQCEMPPKDEVRS